MPPSATSKHRCGQSDPDRKAPITLVLPHQSSLQPQRSEAPEASTSITAPRLAIAVHRPRATDEDQQQPCRSVFCSLSQACSRSPGAGTPWKLRLTAVLHPFQLGIGWTRLPRVRPLPLRLAGVQHIAASCSPPSGSAAVRVAYLTNARSAPFTSCRRPDPRRSAASSPAPARRSHASLCPTASPRRASALFEQGRDNECCSR